MKRTHRVTVNLNDEQKARLERLSERTGMTQSTLCAWFVSECLDKAKILEQVEKGAQSVADVAQAAVGGKPRRTVKTS